MKKISHVLLFVLMIGALLLSACGAAVSTPTSIAGGEKEEPIPVAFIATVDSIAGDQWVLNGQTVTVAAVVIQEGPFHVGDQVKVEGLVNADGSLTVSSVEVSTPQDVLSLPPLGDNSNSSVGTENSANENESNENVSNENGANENTNNENESNENVSNENSANENTSNENSANENAGNENGSNENENNENSANENGGNENESNENEGNENESNENEGNENGNNENGGGENENEESENESNSND